MRLVLSRTENTPDGVFGTLALFSESGGSLALYTMEEDWKDNQRRESCIPAGVYTIQRTIYRRHWYETFEVINVPGRTRILFHPANTEEDVEGCIGLGLGRGSLRVYDEDTQAHLRVPKQAVLHSKAAFTMFMEFMTGVEEAPLTVEWAVGVVH